MLDRLLFAYTSGLLAAVSPCVIVLIPLCLVRFVRQEATGACGGGTDSLAAVASAQGRTAPPGTPSLFVELSLFLLGFQVSYILFGFLLSSILTSRIQDGFKLALGTLFLVASILAWQGRVDPLRLPLVDSAFWTGVSFALLLSFNPCTVPFLALLISVNDSASTLLALLCFAQGLITPALLVVAMGSRILSWLEESAFKMERVKPWTYAMLGGSGIYLLAAPVYTMSAEDSLVGFAGILLSLSLIHSATGKSKEEAALPRTCRILPDGQVSCDMPRRSIGSASAERRRAVHRWNLVIASGSLIALLLLGASFVSEHDRLMHAAADNMMKDAQQPKPRVQPMPTLQLAAAAAAAAVPTDDSSMQREGIDGVDLSESAPATGRIHQLKRKLAARAVASDAAEAASPSTPHAAAAGVDLLSFEHDHLDQDNLEAPSILSRAEVAALSKSKPQQPPPPPPRDVNGVQLSEADLEALAALAAEAADHGGSEAGVAAAKCVDLSMLSVCFQCSLLVWLYRACVLLVATFALAHDRILDFAHALERTMIHSGSGLQSSPSSSASGGVGVWSVWMLPRALLPSRPQKEAQQC